LHNIFFKSLKNVFRSFPLSAACPKEPFSKEKTEKKKADIPGGAWGRRTISPEGWHAQVWHYAFVGHRTHHILAAFLSVSIEKGK